MGLESAKKVQKSENPVFRCFWDISDLGLDPEFMDFDPFEWFQRPIWRGIGLVVGGCTTSQRVYKGVLDT